MSLKDIIASVKVKDLPDMMSISNNILHKDEVAKALSISEAAMKRLGEIAYKNL